MDLGMTSEVRTVPDVRHRVRQLRWFKASFRHDARLISQRYGLAFTVDDRRLTEAFLNWTEAFSASKDFARLDRRDFVTFSAGLLLRELIRARPVEVERAHAALDATLPAPESWQIAHAWPDGFLYTNYCLCILAAVLEQEGTPLTLPALADDLRTWMSYRENAGDDPSLAIAFLDLFTGGDPNWRVPDAVLSRSAMRRAVDARVVPHKDMLAPATT